MIANDFKEYVQIVGKQIYKARITRSYTQKELAILCTHNPHAQSSLISRIERGKKNLEFITIIKIAQALELPWITFFDFNKKISSEKFNDSYSPEERAILELKKIGKIAKEARKKLELVLGDFEKGVGIGIDPSDLSKIERGVTNIRMDRIYRISQALKINLFLNKPID